LFYIIYFELAEDEVDDDVEDVELVLLAEDEVDEADDEGMTRPAPRTPRLFKNARWDHVLDSSWRRLMCCAVGRMKKFVGAVVVRANATTGMRAAQTHALTARGRYFLMMGGEKRLLEVYGSLFSWAILSRGC
jgi:hypothetical protein